MIGHNFTTQPEAVFCRTLAHVNNMVNRMILGENIGASKLHSLPHTTASGTHQSAGYVLPGKCRVMHVGTSKKPDLVCVVAGVQIWEDAHIGLASHFAMCLDFLLCNFRIHSCIILYWTCSAILSQVRPTTVPITMKST